MDESPRPGSPDEPELAAPVEQPVASATPADGRSATIADNNRVVVDVDIRTAWTIERELPPGLAVCLLVSASGPGWDGPIRVEVSVEGRIGPGPAMLTLSGLNQVDRRWSRAALTAGNGTDRITATIEPADKAELTPPEGLSNVALWPEDVPPFRGARPGPASLYEVRPLPGANGEPISTNAWVRPFRPEGTVRPNLLAIDAWLAESQIDYVKQLAADPEAERLPKASWCGGTFVLDRGVDPLAGANWLLRRTATVTGSGMATEYGAIELAETGFLRPRVSFEIRRPLPDVR
ncbi:MAG: hypothetical protein AAF531_19155 [Actinomycetota bacterium]